MVEILDMMESHASLQKQIRFGKIKPSKVHGEVKHSANLVSKINFSLSIIAACEMAKYKGWKCLFRWGYINR